MGNKIGSRTSMRAFSAFFFPIGLVAVLICYTLLFESGGNSRVQMAFFVGREAFLIFYYAGGLLFAILIESVE